MELTYKKKDLIKSLTDRLKEAEAAVDEYVNKAVANNEKGSIALKALNEYLEKGGDDQARTKVRNRIKEAHLTSATLLDLVDTFPKPLTDEQKAEVAKHAPGQHKITTLKCRIDTLTLASNEEVIFEQGYDAEAYIGSCADTRDW